MRSAVALLPIHPYLRHPRTGVPLRALAIRPNGHPLWPMMGGDGSEDDENDWTKVFEGQTPAQVRKTLEDAQAAAAAKGGDDNPWAELFKDQKPEDVKEALENSRKWETRAKGNKTKADQLDELVKTITGKDEEPDAEKIKSDLTAAQRETRATKVENAVLRRADKHEANATLLVDSRSFMDSISELDPSADDFTTKLDDAIKKAVEDNESYKLVATSTSGKPRPVRQQGKPSEGKQGGVQSGAERYRERRAARSGSSSTS